MLGKRTPIYTHPYMDFHGLLCGARAVAHVLVKQPVLKLMTKPLSQSSVHMSRSA